MLSKAKIKYIQSLQRKKYRQRYDKFVAEGDKIVGEMLRHPSLAWECLVATASWLERNQAELPAVPCWEASPAELKQMSSLSTPNEVLAVATPLLAPLPAQTELGDLALFLDGIQDPANLGAILRVADWFGVGQVFLGNGTVDAYNPKAIQSSMGAFLRVSLVSLSTDELFTQYPHTRIMAADMSGDNVFSLSGDEKKGILVLGNEGNGISPMLRGRIQHWVAIPGRGGAESLNVAVAAGVLCAVLGA